MTVARWYMIAPEAIRTDKHSFDKSFLQDLNARCELVSLVALGGDRVLAVFRGEPQQFPPPDANVTVITQIL